MGLASAMVLVGKVGKVGKVGVVGVGVGVGLLGGDGCRAVAG